MLFKKRNIIPNSITGKTSVVVPFIVLLFLMAVSLLSPFLAGDKPIYVRYLDKSYFPIFSDADFLERENAGGHTTTKIYFSELRNLPKEQVKIVMPLIPYAPHKSDMDNAGYTGPFDHQERYTNGTEHTLSGFNRHLLGTGKRGDDVLSGLIHGTKISLTVGLLSMLIASFIGLILGSFAGYFGDNRLKISRGRMVSLIAGLIPAWFYAFYMREFAITDALTRSPLAFVAELSISSCIFFVFLFASFLAGSMLHAFSYFRKTIPFPVDSIISRSIEIIISMPRIILIITIAAIARPSIINLILIIGLTSWTEIARLTRAEMLKLKNMEFIQAARSIGFSELRILFRHAFPNAIAPAMVAVAFGIASAILAESALSFLGIGVPQDQVTWGSLLAAGREHFQAWWLVVFPGLAIFVTVTAFNLIGEGIRDAMDPKTRK